MTNWYVGTEPENVVYAVTCGSEEPFVDVAGIKYSADRGYSESHASSDGYNKKRWNVPNTVVYQTERWNDDDFSYRIPVDTSFDSMYTIILKFSEVYFDMLDEKTFSIKIGDHYVARELDPFERSFGKFMPYDLF